MFYRRYVTEVTAAVAMLSALAFVPNAQAGLLGGGGGAINGTLGGGAFNGAMNGNVSRQPLSASGSLSGNAQVQRPAVKPVVQDASARVQGNVNATSTAAIDQGERAMIQGEAAASRTEAAAKKTATSAQAAAQYTAQDGVQRGAAVSTSASTAASNTASSSASNAASHAPSLHGGASVTGDVSRKGVDVGGSTSGSAKR